MPLDERAMRLLRRAFHFEKREQIGLRPISVVGVLDAADIAALSLERPFDPLQPPSRLLDRIGGHLHLNCSKTRFHIANAA